MTNEKRPTSGPEGEEPHGLDGADDGEAFDDGEARSASEALDESLSAAAPDHLSDEAKQVWLRLVTDYGLEDAAGLAILQTGLEAFDRMRGAQEELRKNGSGTFKDRFGKPKLHPAVTVERDARAAWLAALKQLNLDLEPLRDRPGRPGGDECRRSGGGSFGNVPENRSRGGLFDI